MCLFLDTSEGVVVITSCDNQQADLLHILTSKRCLKILYMMSREDHTATSLAERLDITVPTLSHYLKMLSNANIIEMQPCFNDLRVKRLSLSSRGKAMLFMYENELLFHPMILDE
jgi:DNA-binding MarR family transcriptional regulator